MPALDAAVDSRLPAGVNRWLFSGDADAARSLLGTISSSLITVTALTFSLTVVTLQLASSQFSPRLLRTFTSDLFVQNTLVLFLATFTYALTVLRSVGRGGDGEFVPKPRRSGWRRCWNRFTRKPSGPCAPYLQNASPRTSPERR